MKISVIIPARDEENSIRPLLDSLLNQTLKPAEIVITDGGSSDATPEIISEYVQSGAPVRLLQEPNALPGRSRNVGAAAAVSEWIAFIDAGVRPEINWLESLSTPAANEERFDVVYGSFEPIADTLFKQCAVMAYIAPATDRQGKLVRTRSVASVLMRRSVWQTVGGFPEHLRSAEDLLFMDKIEAAGFRVTYAPDALVHWEVQATWWSTFKRFVVYARNNMRAGLWRQWQAPIFTRYALLAVLALPAWWFGMKWLLIPLLLWLLMLTARGAMAIWRNRACNPAKAFVNAARLCILVPLIATLDAATITGTFQWAMRDKPGK